MCPAFDVTVLEPTIDGLHKVLQRTLQMHSLPAVPGSRLPHTWEDLHPAFPSNPSPSDSHISIGPPFAHPSLGIISGQSYGICALACVAAAGVIKHSNSLPAQRIVGFLFKTTALAATLGVAGSINHEIGERRAASTFLRSRHIEPPPFKLVDRFASWDAND